MSNNSNQRRNYLESILSQIGSMQLIDEEVASKQEAIYNYRVAKDCLSLWCVALYDIRTRLHLPSIGEVKRFLQRINGMSILSAIKIASSLGDDLRTVGLEKSINSYEQFMRSLALRFPRRYKLYGPFKGAIAPVLKSFFESKDPEMFRIAYGWLVFPSRLNVKSERLKDESTKKFLSAWSSYPKYGPLQKYIARRYLSKYISKWFPQNEDESKYLPYMIPHHAGGKVADVECKVLANKYAALGRNKDIDLIAELLNWPYIEGQTSSCCIPVIRRDANFIDISSLEMVPKSYKTYRAISYEPCTRMFFQKGIADGLDYYIRHTNHGFSNHWCITTEKWNRRKCMLGSIDGCYSTIDLSAASDSINAQLVEDATDKSWLYFYLNLSRTPNIGVTLRHDGKYPKVLKLPQKMYGGMGNGLTFRVENIIFGAIVSAAIEMSGGNPEHSRFVVYGDDIVVEREYTEMVEDLLQILGFEVNRDKSFSTQSDFHHLYRESCGAEFLDGYDVTPIRIPRGFQGFLYERDWEFHPGKISGLVDLANRISSCYPTASLILRRNCSQKLPYALITSCDGHIGFKTNGKFSVLNPNIGVEYGSNLFRPSLSVAETWYTKSFQRHLSDQQIMKDTYPAFIEQVVCYQTPFFMGGTLASTWQEMRLVYDMRTHTLPPGAMDDDFEADPSRVNDIIQSRCKFGWRLYENLRQIHNRKRLAYPQDTITVRMSALSIPVYKLSAYNILEAVTPSIKTENQGAFLWECTPGLRGDVWSRRKE